MRRFLILVAVALAATLPALLLRATGWRPSPLLDAAAFGSAILAARFLLSWGAETAELHIAQGLNLAVVAPQPLDELESLVVERFAEIPDHGLSVPVIDAPLVDSDTLPRYIERQSLQDRP